MTQNDCNNASGSLTIDPGASGDSFIQLDINATGEFRIGVDDSDSDAFKISQGSALGTNDTCVISASGQRNLPLQPAFSFYVNTVSNVTGDGTNYKIGTTALGQVFNIGSDMATDGTFTAPVTGKYCLRDTYTFVGISSTMTSHNSTIVTSNRTYTYAEDQPFVKGLIISGTQRALNVGSIILADMDAMDTAEFYIQYSNGGLTADLQAGSPIIRGVAGWLVL